MAAVTPSSGLLASTRALCSSLPGSAIPLYCEYASDAELAFNLCFQLILWGALLACAGLYVKVRIEDHEIHQESLEIRRNSLGRVMNGKEETANSEKERKDSGIDVAEISV